MKFGEQIKKVRKDRNLTQQEMADKLGLSRQAVSNWENDKNLPDIEMLITMSQVFQITLDELILGGTQMNNMTEKLIEDGSSNARIKMSLRGIQIGSGLLALGVVSLLIGVFAPVSMEGYFGKAFTILMLCGIIAFLLIGIKNLAILLDKKRRSQNRKPVAIGGILVLVGMLAYAASLLTEAVSAPIGFGCIAAGVVLIIMGTLISNRSAGESSKGG